MKNSQHIAKLLGPSLMMINASETINSHIWANVSVTQTYLAGTLWFIAGLSIVVSHNYWKPSWTTIITLLGWFIMFGGLGRMFFPESAQQGSGNATIVVAVQAFLFGIGMILSIKGFFSRDDK